MGLARRMTAGGAYYIVDRPSASQGAALYHCPRQELPEFSASKHDDGAPSTLGTVHLCELTIPLWERRGFDQRVATLEINGIGEGGGYSARKRQKNDKERLTRLNNDQSETTRRSVFANLYEHRADVIDLQLPGEAGALGKRSDDRHSSAIYPPEAGRCATDSHSTPRNRGEQHMM